MIRMKLEHKKRPIISIKKLNKRGSEIVEAVMTVPLLVLASIALIHYGVFCYDSFGDQLKLQKGLIEAFDANTSMLNMFQGGNNSAASFEGLFNAHFLKERRIKMHALDEGMLVRTGKDVMELFDF